MTQQFTKEDYQVVLDRIYQLDGMTFSDHQKTDANYAECLARYSDEILSALKIAIEHMKRGQWQPIETAPKDGTTIIIFDSYSDDKSIDGYGVCTARWDYSLKWWIMHQRYSNVISLINPTHWMPLPQPPQERKD